MPDGWQWDSTLFRGSAAHYERGRLPYAPGLARTLAAVLGLDGRGRLLDVGCGPGHELLALVPYGQIRERGFEYREDGTPLRCLRVTEQHELPLA
ncbi:chorismate-binding protein, partial [Streptomyces niveus]